MILATTQTVTSTGGVTFVQLVAVVLGSGGLVAGIAAFFKLRPERDSIVVTAAQGALLVQSGVVDELQEQLKDIRSELARARSAIDEHHREVERLRHEVDQLRAERDQIRSERDELVRERDELQARVQSLEQRLARLENGEG